jgi:hypothetical protein
MRSHRPYDDGMTDGTVRSHAQGMAADKVLAATGRTPEDWYARIDAADGRTIGHPAIVTWLVDQGVDSWWAQGVTIGYEQARGLRIPGQRSDGSFAVSASRQVPGEREAVLDGIVPVFTEAFGFPPTSESRGGKRPSTRWTFPDTVRIAVQRERLTGPERMPDAKAELQGLLAGL